jgi:glycosyltransferase involved in cell wall biosynthesis
MLISIVVPVYNKARSVERSLASIAAQTHRDFEVIVVDDGSTDGSSDVVAAFPDPRFRVVRQANAGPGAARNHGLSLAKGEVVAFLDADDEWMPEYLERNLAALQAAGPSVAAVASGFVEYPNGKDRAPAWRARGLVEGVFRARADTPPMTFVHTVAYLSCWNTVARTDVLRRLGGFYGRDRCLYAEDAWLFLQLLLNAPVLIRFEPLTRFHAEDSELSGNYKGARPLEPFLIDPAPIEASTPAELRPLLRSFLRIRALKAACVLGYWGESRRAASLVRRFGGGDLRAPYFLPAVIASTPVGGWAAAGWRAMKRRGWLGRGNLLHRVNGWSSAEG